MGNIAYKTGEKIYWDKENGNFGLNEKANNLITPHLIVHILLLKYSNL